MNQWTHVVRTKQTKQTAEQVPDPQKKTRKHKKSGFPSKVSVTATCNQVKYCECVHSACLSVLIHQL